MRILGILLFKFWLFLSITISTYSTDVCRLLFLRIEIALFLNYFMNHFPILLEEFKKFSSCSNLLQGIRMSKSGPLWNVCIMGHRYHGIGRIGIVRCINNYVPNIYLHINR